MDQTSATYEKRYELLNSCYFLFTKGEAVLNWFIGMYTYLAKDENGVYDMPPELFPEAQRWLPRD